MLYADRPMDDITKGAHEDSDFTCIQRTEQEEFPIEDGFIDVRWMRRQSSDRWSICTSRGFIAEDGPSAG